MMASHVFFIFITCYFFLTRKYPEKVGKLVTQPVMQSLDTQMADKNVDSQEQPFYSQDLDTVDYDEQHSERSTPSTSVTSTSTYITSRPPSATPVAEQAPKRKKVAVEDKLLMLACEKLQVPAPTSETLSKDEHDSFGQTVAHDLRSMSREQVIHAKKLISDVLYEGQLHNLSISSRVISGNEGYNTGVPYSRVMIDPPYTTSASNTGSNPNHDVFTSYSQY